MIRNLLKSYLIIPPLQHLPLSPQMYASSPEAPFGAESLRWVDVTLSSARPVRSGQRVYYTGHVAGTEVGVRDYWIISSLEY